MATGSGTDVREYRQGDAALTTIRGWCKGCDLCIGSCPAGILELGEDNRIDVIDISNCIFCGICAVRCPDFVFIVHRNGNGSCSS